MAADRPIKVLLTKIGLDGHDRGFRLVAKGLRDAGMEVVPTGPWMKVDDVANIAIQEDAEVIGISSLAFDHLLVPKLMEGLRARNIDDILVILGGMLPDEDVKALLDCGVAAIFHPGSSMQAIVDFIRENVARQRSRTEVMRGTA